MAKIITSGCTFADVDAVACMIALYEAHRAIGEENVFIFLPENLSASVTDDFVKIAKQYPQKKIDKQDEIIFVDVSDHAYLERTCGYDPAQVRAIFDHHPGSEDYWEDRIGTRARIEDIGAAATLVYEYIKKQGVYAGISKDARTMLAAAIIQNTQNFHVHISSHRDRDAFDQLCLDENLDTAWQEEYFYSIDQKSFDDPYAALISDFKPEIEIVGKSFAIAQLELSDTQSFLQKHIDIIRDLLTSVSVDYSFFMSASARDGKTYFYTHQQVTKDLLEDVLDIAFSDDQCVLDKMMLRKEALKKLQDYYKKSNV